MLRKTGAKGNAHVRAGWSIAVAWSLVFVLAGCTASPGDTTADPVGFAPIHLQGTGSVMMGDSVVNRDGSVLTSGYFGAGTVRLANVEDTPSITSEMPNNIFFLKLDKNGDFDWSTTLSYEDDSSFIILRDLIAVGTDQYVALVEVPPSGTVEIVDPDGNTTTIAGVATDLAGMLVLGLDADGSVAWTRRLALGNNMFTGVGQLLSLGDGTFLVSFGADQVMALQGTDGLVNVPLPDGKGVMSVIARLNSAGEALWARAEEGLQQSSRELGGGAILAKRSDGSIAALLFEVGIAITPILATFDLENLTWSDATYFDDLSGAEASWGLSTAGDLRLFTGQVLDLEKLVAITCPESPTLEQEGVFGFFVAAFDGDESCKWAAQFGHDGESMLAHTVVGLENGSSLIYGSRAGSLYLMAKDGSLEREVTAKDTDADEEAYIAFLDANGAWQGGVTLGGTGFTRLNDLAEGPTGRLLIAVDFEDRVVLGSTSPREFVDSSTEEAGTAGLIAWLDAAGNIIGVE